MFAFREYIKKRAWTGFRGGWCLGALLLSPACAAQGESGRTFGEPLPTPVAQRVTETFQREALRLVRLETEHGSILTTPEHPFAAPGSGWRRAGRLVPGDWVVSERFGAVRLLSVHSEAVARPVPVFNLSVASSRAYFVGTDRVLVHNTRCRADSSESLGASIERMTRERDEITREVEALKKTSPASPRIAELKAQRTKLQTQLDGLRRADRGERGVKAQRKEERARSFFALEHAAARKAFEDAEKELAELERLPKAEGAPGTARQEALAKRLPRLKFTSERTAQILIWLDELLELENSVPGTAAERERLDARKTELRAHLQLARKRQANLKHARTKRADPEEQKRFAVYHRELVRRQLRHGPYVADADRPRDKLELLEQELADWLQQDPSESRDERIDHLTEQINTQKRLVEIRRENQTLNKRRERARRTRNNLIAQGADTSRADKKIRDVEAELGTRKIESKQLRMRARLLAGIDKTPWLDSPEAVDEERLGEIERQLAVGVQSEPQIPGAEWAPDPSQRSHADWQAALLAEARDVDEVLSEREELMGQGPSPERAAGLESSYERLEQELREARAAVDGAVSALANEYAYVHTTQAGSSSGPSWQERLRAIQEEQRALLDQWRAGLQARLDSAWQELNVRRRIERFRDEAAEAELVREITLLDRELKEND